MSRVLGFIPTIWSGVLQRHLDKSLVFADRTNRQYEGEIQKAGDKVVIGKMSDVTVKNYVRNTDCVSYEFLDPTTQELEITEEKFWAFRVDDVDEVQSKPALVNPKMLRAAVAIRDVVDRYVADLVVSAEDVIEIGSEEAPEELSVDTMLEFITEIGQRMDEGNVPDDRWIIIPPWVHRLFVLARVGLETQNTKVLDNGKVGVLAGFTIYRSNNCPFDPSENTWQLVAGVDYSTAFASQITRVENLRLEASFGTGVRGLYVFGGKVIEPESLAVITVAEGT